MIEFTPAQLNRLDTARLTTYKTNLDFYNGKQWQQTSRKRQLVFNYAKASVDKCASFLVQGLAIACYATEQTDDSKARTRETEQLLHDVYQDNNLQQLDYETEIDAAILGDGCYKVTWDADQKRIRITAPDVSGIFAWWLGDDTTAIWRVASRYTLTQDEISLLYGAATSKPSATVTELWTAKDLVIYLDNDPIQSKPNPYGFIPFIIFPNVKKPKQFWGDSDIPAMVQPQRELNRALSQLSCILELSGNPVAVIENLRPGQDVGDIKVEPGGLWQLGPDVKAYLLDLLQGGGVRLHIDYIDVIYRSLHDVSEMPRAAWGGIERDLSGSALRIELSSLIQKIIRKRTIRTNVYRRRTQMILDLAKKYQSHNSDGVTYRVLWGPVLPQDVDRQAQNEQLLVQAGVHSRRTAMDEMGIQDPDEEFARWLEERQKILEMNQELRAQSTRGGARERAVAPEMEVPE